MTFSLFVSFERGANAPILSSYVRKLSIYSLNYDIWRPCSTMFVHYVKRLSFHSLTWRCVRWEDKFPLILHRPNVSLPGDTSYPTRGTLLSCTLVLWCGQRYERSSLTWPFSLFVSFERGANAPILSSYVRKLSWYSLNYDIWRPIIHIVL